eukprot:4183572-Lingulodinium_polyedra.AAC.1
MLRNVVAADQAKHGRDARMLSDDASGRTRGRVQEQRHCCAHVFFAQQFPSSQFARSGAPA